MTGESAREIETETAKPTRKTAGERAKDVPIAKGGAEKEDATTEHRNAGGKRTPMRLRLRLM